MLAPLSITRSFVVDSGQELKLIQWHLLGLDPQLVVELSLSCSSDALDRRLQVGPSLPRYAKRVRTASVGPHARKGNLLRRPLLQKKSILGIKKEDGESPVQEAFVDVLHQVAF